MVTTGATAETNNWNVIGATARGALHVKNGLPNQDCHAYGPATRAGDGAILAVADGHGDARCVRADVGARLAVEAATTCGRDFMDARSADPTMPLTAGVVTSELVPGIVARWRAAVQRHREDHPWKADELHVIDPRRPGEMPYGSTLLLAAVLGSSLVLVQIGDGDMLVVDGAGAALRPIGPAEVLVGGETLSLAASDAVGAASSAVVDLDDTTRMVLLATDGYANSFDDVDWAHLIGSDYMQLLRDHGPQWMEAQLPGWVEASASAAGDDVTVLLAVRA